MIVCVGSVLCYLAVGCVYARWRSVSCFQDAVTSRRVRLPRPCCPEDDPELMRVYRKAVVRRVFLWVVMVWWDVAHHGVARFMHGRVHARIDHVRRLREDAQSWSVRAADGAATPVERETAAELARVCGEYAKELEW